MVKYKRILLKLSGESLTGSQNYGIDENRLNEYAGQIAEIVKMGVQVGIVIGGGNIFRGLSGSGKGFDRVKGDQMGMLATAINSLALSSALQNFGIKSHVFTAIRMEPVGEFYSKQKALDALEKGEVAIISAGTGNPYFTTDTASALRAVETGAEIMLKGTRVDGVYSADPEKVSNAKKFEKISFADVYENNLRIMDLTATTLCRENNLQVLVFNMDKPGNLKKIIAGEKIGTIVYP
jgi:uridylate kinase